MKDHHCNIIQSLFDLIIAFIEDMLSSIGNRIFSFIYSFVEKKKIPPATNPLLKESAVALAEKIRTQKVSSYWF